MIRVKDSVVRDPDRWSQAQALLDRVANPNAHRGQQVRRRQTLWFLVLFLALPLVAAAAGFLITGRRPHHSDHHTTAIPAWQNALGLTCSSGGLVLIIIGIVMFVRSGQWGSRWRAPTAVLSREQRRDLMRQIRGKAPVDAAHLALARDLAQRFTVQYRLLFFFLAGAVLSQVGSLILDFSRIRIYLVALILACYVSSGFLGFRDIRYARRFLTHDRERETSEQDEPA